MECPLFPSNDDTQADEAAPYLRLAKITYPDGREVYYNYASGIAGDISRVSEIADDDLDNGSRTVYAQYSHLGAGTIVKVEHPGVTGGLTLDYGADGAAGWDRFGRVTGQTWTNAAETTTFDDFAYTYDRASNRLTRDLSLTTGLDEKYTYDALNRLTNTERGTLSAGSITSSTFEQDWSLDQLGNWDEFAEDADGDGTADLDQDRTHNDANELTGITETTGESWIDPAHDAAGNMTLAPRPGDEADANDGLLLVYDAWNRLVKVYDDDDGDGQADEGELTVTYEYDGQRRLVEKTIEGDPDVTYDNYYNSDWQLLEVRRADDPDPQDQYVWDLRYIDASVARSHDGNTDGDYDDAEDSILYYTTDANFNVTGVVNDSGNVVERYAYDPYGAVTVLDGTTGGQTDWATDADQVPDVANEILYSGYRFDAETGLYIVRNRIYHPTLGRLVQRDPMRYADGMSVYEYVQAGPLARTDPSGLATGGDTRNERVVEVRFRPASRIGSPGTTETAESALSAVKIIGAIYSLQNVVIDGIQVGKDITLALCDYLIAEQIAVNADEMVKTSKGFNNKVMRNEGVAIWVHVEYERCEWRRYWYFPFLGRNTWVKKDKWVRGSEKGLDRPRPDLPYGFRYDDREGIEKAIPKEMKRALKEVK